MTALKAFTVSEDQEGRGGVIFAKTAIEARRLGASEWNDGELGGMHVHRSPGLDKFSPGPVPAWVLIADGWWWECSGCYERIDLDYLDEAGLDVTGVRGTTWSMVFCCATCEAEYRDDERAKEAAGQAVISVLIEILHRRFHGQVTVGKSHHYTTIERGLLTTQEARVEFTFPGQKIGPAMIRLHRDDYRPCDTLLPPSLYLTCCAGDKEAFEKFAEECRG